MIDLLANPFFLTAAIFLARVTDVALGTFRTILVFRGYRLGAALLGFFEALIWVAAAGRVLQDLGQWYLVVAFAGGFATGNVVGMWLEARLAVGSELMRAVSPARDVNLAERLRERGYVVTALTGRAAGGGPVEVLFVVESRRRLRRLVTTIGELDPTSVVTTSDVKTPRTVRPPSRFAFPSWSGRRSHGLRK